MTDAVQAQYEAYPYPARQPEDERRRLVVGSPSQLTEIDHYVFAGRRDWSKPFRALVAGGGTGDGLIMLAQQLKDHATPAEIVYLDLSSASRRIAEERARVRGLTGIRFETGSLLDAAEFGPFDYIDCCGVLHHLPNPVEGFRALAGALGPTGGMGGMVYGEFGRTGVYEMQELLRRIAPPDTPLSKRVETARRLLAELPATNRFARNPYVSDHQQNDAGLVDLLLHGQDRAYRVTDLLQDMTDGGFRLASFIPTLLYEPSTYLVDPSLLNGLEQLNPVDRMAAAEELAGNMQVHVFYAAPAGRTEDSVARPTDANMVPLLVGIDGAALARTLSRGKPLSVKQNGLELQFPMPDGASEIVALIDGQRTLAEVHQHLTASTRPGQDNVDLSGFMSRFDDLYRVLNGLNRLLLRRRNT